MEDIRQSTLNLYGVIDKFTHQVLASGRFPQYYGGPSLGDLALLGDLELLVVIPFAREGETADFSFAAATYKSQCLLRLLPDTLLLK